MNNMETTALDWFFDKIKSHFQHNGDLLESVTFTYAIAKEKERKIEAAAPLMYDALEKIKSMCDGNKDVENNIWHIANKALKKATEL